MNKYNATISNYGRFKQWSLKIPKGGNQKPQIEEEQTTQRPKERGQTTIDKILH